LITLRWGLQDRLTDHRINYSVNNLDGVMEGDGDSGLEDIISELRRNTEMGLIEDMLETVEKGDSSP
jgi:peptide chain release factor 1